MDELLQDFISETAETMEEISGEIVAWEASPGDRERLDSIFRFVHTVKGSCGFLDLTRIGALSHAAEDALDKVRNGERQPTPRLVSAVLAIIDRIVELTEVMATTGSEPEGTDDDLITAIASDGPSDELALAISDGAVSQIPQQSWRTIRVPLHLLDTIMNGVSDMVLARNEVARLLRQQAPSATVSSAFERLSSSVADMRNSVSQMRMQRIEKLFSALPRMVRDLGQELGKQVELIIDGGEVEIDREMIEMIRDPLTHIVRNAIDHGLETTEQRTAAGKSATGTLRISARQSGNQIIIDVRDDGAGISVDRLVAKAVAAKVVTANESRNLSAREKLDLIFSPGLSTAKAVTSISGRGVGMDVVRSNIERIGGVVELDNQEGEGLAVSLRVPLTLTIISGLTVSAGGQLFAIPRASVSEIILQMNDTVRIDRAGGAEIAIVRGQRLSLVYLEDILQVARPETEDDIDRSIVITRGANDLSYALSVADVFDHEELVIKPASPAIMASGLYAGTTLPDSGRPMLLLDVAGIATLARVGSGESEMTAQDAAADQGRLDDERDMARQILLFREFDGTIRAIRMGVIERVDDVPTHAISRSAGQLRALVGDQLVSMVDIDIPPDVQRVKLLRLNDGTNEIGYAMEEVVDLGVLPRDIEPASQAGRIAAVALIDGHPVELLDPWWLFESAGHAGVRSSADRPTCCLTDAEDHWTRQFLAPLVESAGYRVVLGTPSEAADIVITSETVGGGHSTEKEGAVVRLRSSQDPSGADDTSIYRYDRPGLLAALAAKAGAA